MSEKGLQLTEGNTSDVITEPSKIYQVMNSVQSTISTAIGIILLFTVVHSTALAKDPLVGKHKTELSGKNSYQSKEKFVTGIVKEMREEIEENREKNRKKYENGILFMSEKFTLAELEEDGVIEDLGSGVFGDLDNPEGYYIELISSLAPNISKKIAGLEPYSQKKYGFQKVSKAFQTQLDLKALEMLKKLVGN